MRCRRSDSRNNRHNQRGAALVVAMLVFALCASLVVAMQGEFSRIFARSAGVLFAEQAHAYLLGAEDLAGMALINDYDLDQQAQNGKDDLTEIWAQPAPPYALDEGGWMTGRLTDLQGLFNLNGLGLGTQPQPGAANKERFTAREAQFIRLLQALGEPEVSEYEAIAITESIADWLDADNNPRDDGAEDDFYSGREPALRAGNQPMASVSELLLVANMTPEIYLALAPYVTVWPDQGSRINIHTAPLAVLRSINEDDVLSPITGDEAQSLVDYREETGFADLTGFLDHPVFASRKQKMNDVKSLLDTRSSYFLLSAEVELAQRNMRLYSVLERRDRSVVTLVRAGGSL
ncbi:MAG: type II secretion system minor pseudopilin GspK [Halioglobus sp.]|nr:type II secretion system minor pseudopilin GspK [Halioglobus sp.]